jgi:hypothetical protein
MNDLTSHDFAGFLHIDPWISELALELPNNLISDQKLQHVTAAIGVGPEEIG